MEHVSVTDLYQAAYFICCGCSLESVQCIPVNTHVACKLTFSGPALERLQEEYFTARATVNLYSFRQAYSQVQSYIHSAKKSYAAGKKKEGGGI